MRALLLALAFAAPAAADCADPATLDVTGAFGTARFDVAVADEPAERSRGLMFVERLGPREGMLFVYEMERDGVAFWMENTLIPLDMIFAAGDGTVVSVHAEAVPLDRTPIRAGAPTQFVLEVPGGRAAALGIAPGDRLVHPALPTCTGPRAG